MYDPTVVSNIEITDEKISFDVSRTGTPVLIKVSHSSRWEASGATGPFRTAPNFMLVVPTEPRVELTFKTPFTAMIAPWLSLLLLLGLLSFRLKLLIHAHKSRTTSSGSGQ